MNHLAAYFLLQTLSAPPRTEQPETPPPPPAPRWQRAALMRGYYTFQQTAAATRLALAEFAGTDPGKAAARIAHWERQIKANDIHPATPGKMKSVWSFLLHMAGYIGPVIAICSAITVGAGMVTTTGMAALAGIAATCLINTHQAAGEAFLQTARNKPDLLLQEDGALAAALNHTDFRRMARNNVLLKSGISLVFTAAAGPAARLFGSFSNGVIHGILNYTPLGHMISTEVARNLENSILRSLNKSLGSVLANLSIRNGKGSQSISTAFAQAAAATTAIVTIARTATNAVFNRTAEKPAETEPSETAKAFSAAVVSTAITETLDAPANDDEMPVPARSRAIPPQPL